MELSQFGPGENDAMTVDNQVFCSHFAASKGRLRKVANGANRPLSFRWSRSLFLGFRLRRLGRFPADWRSLGSRSSFLAIQISRPPLALGSHPMLLTHIASIGWKCEARNAKCGQGGENASEDRIGLPETGSISYDDFYRRILFSFPRDLVATADWCFHLVAGGVGGVCGSQPAKDARVEI
jgi:hypothetical protein